STGWNIDNRLGRHAFAGSLTVFAFYRDLRTGWLRLDFKRSFTPHESKRWQIKRVLASKVDNRFHRLISRTHDAQVVFAGFQICEGRRAFLRMIAQNHERPTRLGPNRCSQMQINAWL